MAETKITVPHNFTPRDYQIPLFNCISQGYKRAMSVWHRRAGKDKTLINIMVKEMFKNVGSYYYFFPSYAQGKKIIWDGTDRDGFRFLDHIPKEVRENENQTEMKIRTNNGSLFQIVGSDNIDSIVGTNPIGCVFSEYALQDPRGWIRISPILAENGGWAIFNSTPRGHNHMYKLWKRVQSNKKWFTEQLTIEDTGAISLTALQDERDAGIPEDLIQQEYYVSFDEGVVGAYYAPQLKRARGEGRLTKVPHDPNLKVHTAWDIGVDDPTSILFYQNVGREIHIIDCYENSGEGFGFYAEILDSKNYRYGKHYAPHDIEVREMGIEVKTRKQSAAEVGINFTTVERGKKEDGIEAVRRIFHSLWIDNAKCEFAIECFMNYRKEWDVKHEVYKLRSVHDWSSHFADALRMLAVSHKFGSQYSVKSLYQQQLDHIDKYNVEGL